MTAKGRRAPVIAYHLVWTAYGTWLPNDPRGSGSHDVAADALAELGPVHFGRRKDQPARRLVRDFYEQAEPRLRFPVLQLGETERRAAANGFADAIREGGYTCYACAIMLDHAHFVVRKHRDRAEEMIERLQDASRSRLYAAVAVPAEHPVWTVGRWRSFLSSPEAVRSAIRYVESNPAKSGLAPQRWPFVVEYDGWPFHKRG